MPDWTQVMDGPSSGTRARKAKRAGTLRKAALADQRAATMREIAERIGRSVGDAVLVSSAGRVVFVNSGGEHAFGYGADELGELGIDALLPGIEQTIEASLDSAPEPLACEARRKDGTTFPAQLSFSRMSLDREYEIAIVRDLSGQRRVEDELRRTRDQLADAQRLAKIGSWEWDIPADRVSWSDELFRIYGFEPGAFTPSYESFLERVHPDDRDSVDARNHKAFADHEPFEDVKRCTRPDGSVFLMRTNGEVIADDAGRPERMLGICEDVTAELEGERVQAELAAIVASSDDAIYASTLAGEITSWSPGAVRLYGYEPEEALGRPVTSLVASEYRDAHETKIERLIDGETVSAYEASHLTKDGSRIDVSVGISPVRRADGSLSAVSTIARDIAERRRFEAQLKHLADHDALTGLANRRHFETDLDRRVAEVGRYGSEGTVLMLDLDNFKYVNDAFGHRAGDELLRSVAQLLRSRIRETDTLARLGGDEFAIFLSHADAAAAATVAGDLLEALREHVVPIDGRPVRVTASIGIICVSEATATGEDLLAEADRAMYEAKDSGRDRAVNGTGSERGHRGETRLGWEHRIHEALDRDLFVVHCQPILDLRADRVSQYELLLRMAEGEELVLPGAFLGVAERLGLIHAIDRWVVGEAMRLLALHPALRLEVNLSARSLDDPSLLALIRDGIAEHEIDPSRLIFEITETAAIGNIDVAWRFGAALDELGCSFALDDFGAGFGSFYYLKHLPVEYLKIDGDFVSSPRTLTDELVIDSMVRIARGSARRRSPSTSRTSRRLPPCAARGSTSPRASTSAARRRSACSPGSSRRTTSSRICRARGAAAARSRRRLAGAARRDHRAQSPAHRRAGAAEGLAEAIEVALGVAVMLFDQPGRHQDRGGEGVRLLLGRARGDRRAGGRAGLGIDRGGAAEERLAAASVKHVVADLVSDREPPTPGPEARLLAVHPDLAEARDEEAGEGDVVGELRAARRRAHLRGGDVPDAEAEVAVGDLLDRDRRAIAVPDVVGKAGEHRLGSALDLLHRADPNPPGASAWPEAGGGARGRARSARRARSHPREGRSERAETGGMRLGGSWRVSRTLRRAADRARSEARRLALRRQRAGVGDPALHPRLEPAPGSNALGIDPQPSVHRPPAHLERPHVWLGEQRLALGRLDPRHQAALAADRDRHPAADQEGEAAEHRLLADAVLVADQLTDAVGEFLVVGHLGIMMNGRPLRSRP